MLELRVLRHLVIRLLALSLAVPAGAGTVEGSVALLDKGGRPAKDLSEVVVYLEGVEGPLPPVTASITMERKTFEPHLVVIPVGGTVEFPNADPIFHNVFSITAPNTFDLDFYKKPETGSWTFRHPGVVKVYCNIHPQMRAVVVVRDNPYYAQADERGTFRIEGVPAGTHVLTAWHERAEPVSTRVTVPAEGSVAASISLDASTFKFKRHMNKHGKPYRQKDY